MSFTSNRYTQENFQRYRKKPLLFPCTRIKETDWLHHRTGPPVFAPLSGQTLRENSSEDIYSILTTV